MDVNFRKIDLKDAVHLIPPGSLYLLSEDSVGGAEYEGEALLYEGDLRLEELSLDYLADEAEDVLLYIITGSLIVNHSVHSESTDGAISLVVLGNMQARNMIVGGQEIYIGGDLTVEELLWGDYNHGLLTVKGAATARVCLQTEDYEITVHGQSRWQHHLLEWEEALLEEDADGRTLATWFDSDCLYEYEGQQLLDRTQLIERLRAGKPCFLPPEDRGVLEFEGLEQFVFPSVAIAPEILDMATAPSLMPAKPEDQEENESQTMIFHREWWDITTDFFYRLTVGLVPETRALAYQGVYIQQDEHLAVIIELPAQRKGGQEGTLGMQWRRMDVSDAPWQNYDANRDTELAELLPTYWQSLLRELSLLWNTGQYVSAERIQQLLALPLVEPYDDYEDDDRCGLWLGNWYFGFQQENGESEGEPLEALLEIGREYVDTSAEDEDTRTERFFYTVRARLDGRPYVEIQYEQHEEAELEDISHTNAALVRRALRVLNLAEQELLNANQRLLAGEPVGDDKFALRYWRKKGYLR